MDDIPLLKDIDEEEAKASEHELQRFERQALQEAVSEIFVNLCSSDNEVRECLFSEAPLTQLCEFFGNNRSNKAEFCIMHQCTL